MTRAGLGDRRLFPHLEAIAYLNHAGISPASTAVREAVIAIVDDYGRRGAGAFLTWQAQRLRLKEKLAALVGARPADLALMPNTTRGVIEIASSLPWKGGDRVVLFDGEFPANVTPWQRAAERFGLVIEFLSAREYVRDEPAALSRLEATLAGGARLVAVSAVQFQSGVRMPLAKISELVHAAGGELFVDAVQAVGSTPIDVVTEGIDYLACGSHKWLMGLEGAGFLYVAPPRIDALRPAGAGWLSHEEGLSFLFEGAGKLRYDRPLKRSTDVFEGANLNAAGCAALEASVDLLLEVGIASIHRHINDYVDAIEPSLVARGFESLRRRDAAGRSGLLCLEPPAGFDVIALQLSLASRGVMAATPDGLLRLSPHFPNAKGEIPGVIAAFDFALTGRGG